MFTGFHIAFCPSSCSSVEATPMQYQRFRRTVLRSKGHEGHDILCSTLLGGIREWVCEAKHACLWRRPVRAKRPKAVKEALNLLQCRIFCILCGTTCEPNHSCLGANSFRNGRWLRGIRSCNGNGIDKLDMWHSILQEQAPTRQYFNSHCSSSCGCNFQKKPASSI